MMIGMKESRSNFHVDLVGDYKYVFRYERKCLMSAFTFLVLSQSVQALFKTLFVSSRILIVGIIVLSFSPETCYRAYALQVLVQYVESYKRSCEAIVILI